MLNILLKQVELPMGEIWKLRCRREELRHSLSEAKDRMQRIDIEMSIGEIDDEIKKVARGQGL